MLDRVQRPRRGGSRRSSDALRTLSGGQPQRLALSGGDGAQPRSSSRYQRQPGSATVPPGMPAILERLGPGSARHAPRRRPRGHHVNAAWPLADACVPSDGPGRDRFRDPGDGLRAGPARRLRASGYPIRDPARRPPAVYRPDDSGLRRPDTGDPERARPSLGYERRCGEPRHRTCAKQGGRIARWGERGASRPSLDCSSGCCDPKADGALDGGTLPVSGGRAGPDGGIFYGSTSERIPCPSRRRRDHARLRPDEANGTGRGPPALPPGTFGGAARTDGPGLAAAVVDGCAMYGKPGVLVSTSRRWARNATATNAPRHLARWSPRDVPIARRTTSLRPRCAGRHRPHPDPRTDRRPMIIHGASRRQACRHLGRTSPLTKLGSLLPAGRLAATSSPGRRWPCVVALVADRAGADSAPVLLRAMSRCGSLPRRDGRNTVSGPRTGPRGDGAPALRPLRTRKRRGNASPLARACDASSGQCSR